jgi:hypothetical protein
VWHTTAKENAANAKENAANASEESHRQESQPEEAREEE